MIYLYHESSKHKEVSNYTRKEETLLGYKF